MTSFAVAGGDNTTWESPLMESGRQTVLDNKGKPTVMIGFLANVGVSPIPTITRVFMDGLGEKYRFTPFFRNRKHGNTEAGSVTLWNAYYMMKHLTLWTTQLARRRPDIAHYPLTGGWNLEKCLYFLRIAKGFRAKTVAHLHGGAFDDFWTELSPGRKARANKVLRSLDAVVVLGDHWREWVSKNTEVPSLSRGVDGLDVEGQAQTTPEYRYIAPYRS